MGEEAQTPSRATLATRMLPTRSSDAARGACQARRWLSKDAARGACPSPQETSPLGRRRAPRNHARRKAQLPQEPHAAAAGATAVPAAWLGAPSQGLQAATAGAAGACTTAGPAACCPPPRELHVACPPAACFHLPPEPQAATAGACPCPNRTRRLALPIAPKAPSHNRGRRRLPSNRAGNLALAKVGP